MLFEWDENKSEANKAKHGISFGEALAIFKDPEAVIIPARTSDEPRLMIIGKALGKLWSAIYTLRNAKTRIISVRRARKEEENIYE